MILVTRDKKQSDILATKLKSKGHNVVIDPLFEVHHIKILPKLDVDDLQAILITSSNSIPFLRKLNIDQKTKILAIGEKTAKKIKNYGYSNIIFADGNAISLKKLAIKNLSKNSGYVLYLSGQVITLDLAKELKKFDFKVKRVIAYKIKEKTFLSKDAINKIKNQKINKVLIYSQNTAFIFYRLIIKHNLLEYCHYLTIECISNKVADYFKKLGFTKITKLSIE